MSRSSVVLLVLGFAILAGLVFYSSRNAADRQGSAAINEDAGRTNSAMSATEVGGGMADSTGSDEPVHPIVAADQERKPLWELSHEQLHEHVDDLRALVNAGWGQAVLPLTRLVSECHDHGVPRSEGEIRGNARSRRERLRRNVDHWPEDRLRSEYEHIERMLEFELESMNRRRRACDAVTGDDVLRIMDWLELALEQRHPAFLAGYLRWDILPDDKAWRVRYAERLASFNQRFEIAYLDGVYAGEFSMLDLASRLYSMRQVLHEPDPYRAFAFNHAADLAVRRNVGMRREFAAGTRLNAADLDPALVREARAEGERIYERCCADARMSRSMPIGAGKARRVGPDPDASSRDQ